MHRLDLSGNNLQDIPAELSLLNDLVNHIKQKLLHYYNVVMADSTNILADHQLSNYKELLIRYDRNGRKLEGMKDQYLFDTLDWIRCIDAWNLPNIFKNPNCLPISKKKWIGIIETKWREIYRSEFDSFITGNGRVIALMFGLNNIRIRHSEDPYCGFMRELKIIYSNNISTENISRSLKVLMNSTKLNYCCGKSDGDKYCPFCNKKLVNRAAFHLISLCPEVPRKEDMKWLDCRNFSENVMFLEELQLMIDGLDR